MNRLKTSLQDVFSMNRAEEIGYDVWRHFVVPPFFNYLDLYTARKPRVIIGGRGCGKTMLLRYLSHKSMFSPNRESIPENALSHIGLFWRADTQFCSAMRKRNVPEDVWESAFGHLAALILGIEVLDSLDSIALSRSGLLILKMWRILISGCYSPLMINSLQLLMSSERRLIVIC